jgi:O-antigen/teichoic acid export membrane protein
MSPGERAQPPGAPEGLTGRTLAGLFWTFSGTGVQLVAQLLVIMVLGRLLTPAEFGIMGAASVIIALSQIVSQIGVGPAIIQRQELTSTHIRVAFTLSGVLGIFLGLGIWLAAPAIAAFYRIPAVESVLRGIALLFPIDGLNTVGESLLARQLRFRLYAALDVASYVLGYAVVGVFFAWRGYGVWALVIANLAQVTLRTVSMYAVTRHEIRPSFDLQASRELLSFGFGLSLAQIGRVFAQQGDNLVVGRWLGPAALGLYGRAYTLMVMPAAAFGRVVNRVLFPVMAQVQDNPERLARAYERGLAIVALIALPISAFLLVVAPEFIPILLGPAWTGVVVPFRLFTISLLFHMSSMISDTLTKATGAVYARAMRQAVYAALVVLGAFIGQHWGVGGVAVAVSLAMGINYFIMAQLSRSVSGLSWSRFVRAQLPGALFAAVIGVTALAIATASRTAGLGNLPVLVLASLGAALAVTVTMRFRPELLLGPHGRWAQDRAGDFLRQGVQRVGSLRQAGAERLASAGKANLK